MPVPYFQRMEGVLEPLQGGIGMEMLVTKKITGVNMFSVGFPIPLGV